MQPVVLISGASSGIGMETAHLLAENGYIVYGAARRVERMDALKPYGVKIIGMDVVDDKSMTAAIKHILNNEGRLDILINNAGFGFYGAVEDVSLEDARYQMEVNVLGAARLAQLVLPGMRDRRYGKIINISSIAGKVATPFGGWYHASKFALEGLSDSLRNEVKPFGIDVILIEPGGIKSEWGPIAFENLEKSSERSIYKEAVSKFATAFKKTMDKHSDPDVIAKLILKAIEAERPKARYSAGYMAKPTLLMRKLLCDKMLDSLFLRMLK
jgi:NAD(P)-dependent dehydrogenase (short-subunit alcohol dehydrogenase family)